MNQHQLDAMTKEAAEAAAEVWPDEPSPAGIYRFAGLLNAKIEKRLREAGALAASSDDTCLRDKFALAALPSVIDAAKNDRHDGVSLQEHFARLSYTIADAMLKARQS